MILLGISQSQSIKEMANKVQKGTSLVQYRLNRLIDEGYVSRPAKRQARAFRITPTGREILKQYGVKAQQPQ
jgi:predicted methyltransferase